MGRVFRWVEQGEVGNFVPQLRTLEKLGTAKGNQTVSWHGEIF